MGDCVANVADARVIELIRRHGRHTCSFQALESGLSYWFAGDDACVAFADTGSAWIAAGNPIAALAHQGEVAARFMAAATRARRRSRFFALEAPLDGVLDQADLDTIVIGSQPHWDPATWARTLRHVRSLREQLRRARGKGVRVRELSPMDIEPMRPRIDAVIERWLASRRLAPMGFLVEVEVHRVQSERLFLVAEVGDELVGLLVAVPIYARNGWFFEDVIRVPDAPNGTVELLFDHAMRLCGERGSRHVSFGMAPLADVTSAPLRWIRDHSRWLYDFEGVRQFKAKLRPCGWDPIHLGFPRGTSPWLAVLDSLRAFARGSFVRFGWNSALHRARHIGLDLSLRTRDTIARHDARQCLPAGPEPVRRLRRG